MSYAERLLLVVKKMVEDHLARWNPFVGDTTITIPGEALPPPEKSPYAPAGAAFDARRLWGRPLQEGAPDDGDAYLWNAEAEAFVLGAASGGGGTGIGGGAGFRASLGVPQLLSATPSVISMSAEDYDNGEHYEPFNYAWTPPAGPVAFVFRIHANTNVDVVASIYKNGAAIYSRPAGRYSYGGGSWVETAFMDLASGTDVYTLYASSGEGPTLQPGTTYWAGMVAGGGGGGAGPGIPPPYAYLVDSDGKYLLDADGAYLWEYV